MFYTRREFIEQLGVGIAGFGLLSAVPGTVAIPRDTSLPRSLPDAQGVSSAGIVNFIQVAERRRFRLHSLMVLRHGHVVAEGWWAPYRADLKHSLYSLSKSVTAMAVGMAVSERLFTIDDPVISFFPDDLPTETSPLLANLRVKHLLNMSTGHALSDGEIFPRLLGLPSDNWVRTFLALPIAHEPGTRFSYNTMATYMLGRIVQKLSKQTLMEFLTPRLFEPLGIEGADWEIDTRGNNVGGWGLRLKTEDIAKFGQLLLQNGVWNEKQVVSSAWVDAATQVQIVQPRPDKPKRSIETDDWLQGYGYQLWGCRNGAYRADGACGQFCIVLPDEDAVIAITAEQADMQAVLDEVWNHLLPAFQRTNQTTEATQHSFRRAMESLAITPPSGPTSSLTASMMSGKRFSVLENTLGISQFSLVFGRGNWTLELTDKQGKHQIQGGLTSWREGITDISPLPLKLLPTPVPNETRYPIAASGAWRETNTFVMTIRYLETAHYDTLTCRFDGKSVQLTRRDSLSEVLGRKEQRPVLEGYIG